MQRRKKSNDYVPSRKQIEQRYQSVVNMCCNYLNTKLDIYNCIEMALFAENHNLFALIKFSIQFIDRNFEEALTSDEFLEMSIQDMRKLLSLLEYNVMSKTDVRNAVLLWSKYKQKSRKQHLNELLR